MEDLRGRRHRRLLSLPRGMMMNAPKLFVEEKSDETIEESDVPGRGILGDEKQVAILELEEP